MAFGGWMEPEMVKKVKFFASKTLQLRVFLILSVDKTRLVSKFETQLDRAL